MYGWVALNYLHGKLALPGHHQRLGAGVGASSHRAGSTAAAAVTAASAVEVAGRTLGALDLGGSTMEVGRRVGGRVGGPMGGCRGQGRGRGWGRGRVEPWGPGTDVELQGWHMQRVCSCGVRAGDETRQCMASKRMSTVQL